MTLVNAPGSFRRSGRSGNGKDRIRRVGTQQNPGRRAGRRPERSGWKRKKGLCGYRAPDFSGGGISTVVKRKVTQARSRDAENRQAETGRFAAVVRPARVPGVRPAHTLRRIADAETRSCGSRKGGRSIHAGVNNSAKVVRKFDNRNFPNGKDRKTVEIHPPSEPWKGCGQIGWEGPDGTAWPRGTKRSDPPASAVTPAPCGGFCAWGVSAPRTALRRRCRRSFWTSLRAARRR